MTPNERKVVRSLVITSSLAISWLLLFLFMPVIGGLIWSILLYAPLLTLSIYYGIKTVRHANRKHTLIAFAPIILAVAIQSYATVQFIIHFDDVSVYKEGYGVLDK